MQQMVPVETLESKGGASVYDSHHPPSMESDRSMRTLWFLPSDLSNLSALESGDGFSARPNIPDENGRGRRRGADGRNLRQPLRQMPGMHGLRDCVPVRRAVWKADRGNAGADRAQLPASVSRSALSQADLLAVPASESAALADASAVALSEIGAALAAPQEWAASPAAGTAALHGIAIAGDPTTQDVPVHSAACSTGMAGRACGLVCCWVVCNAFSSAT